MRFPLLFLMLAAIIPPTLGRIGLRYPEANFLAALLLCVLMNIAMRWQTMK